MAQFGAAEQVLLKNVQDDKLRDSLSQLRQAMEIIWAHDAPRVIQDYTDHGVQHCERIAGYASKLLEANDGRDLSSIEMYLLIAGIYLHDIGMQCDVQHWPAIKDIAERKGAEFAVEFKAERANAYNFDEQKAIRKNHHLLSI